jgi:magnesium-transporting ATPase (P-type)
LTGNKKDETPFDFWTECNKKSYVEMIRKAKKSEDTVSDKDLVYFPWNQVEDDYTQKIIHFTYVFQIFVFMQVFNQINARKLGEREFNVFQGIFLNPFFMLITVLTVVIQVFLVEYGGRPVKAYPLNLNDNYICLALGAGELIWGIFLKFLPVKLFQCVKMNDAPMTEEEFARSTRSVMKGGKNKNSTSKKSTKSDAYQNI